MCSSSQTPVKTNKKKERRFKVFGYIVHHRLHEVEEEAALERLSLFFSLSLSLSLSLLGKNTLSKKAQLLTHFAVCTSQLHHSVQFAHMNMRCVIIVSIISIISIISFRQKGERERSEISLARTPRESNSSALGEIQNKKPLSCLFVFVSKTDSYYSLQSKPPHGSYMGSGKLIRCNHRQSQSTPPLLSFY